MMRDRHCEERSDATIRESPDGTSFPGSLHCARDDDDIGAVASTHDRAGEGFLRALAEADRGFAAKSEDRPPRPHLKASVDFGPAAAGGEARWDFAMQWTDDQVPPLSRPAADPASAAAVFRSETAAAIAQDLGVGAALTERQLASRWRRFVWLNHPDRQPAHERARAGQRVAIANALYDAARRELAKGR